MQKLRLVKVGFTITAVYTLQLLWLNGEQYILPCLINTIIGCLIASAVPSGCGHSGITGYCVRTPMTLQKPIRK
ncbi:gyhfK [Escherichia coli]|uniref:GyhfK n=2 Tax=Escherichia coli TaxID=562 RepID=A0A3T0RKW4_ECOLX|nr:gyhfK [Escherichia coli]EAO9587779.1 gyhfK [Salmonella enterica]EBC9908037.1 gyhfK [Salmonella enterica subsp. enterica serovar Tennessee]EFN6839083.1 gyhfK [Escherichia coli H51]EFO2054819.1 gyhfK [Escherichia coli O32]KEJ43549.1 putative membrane protein [Escherichia coli 2-427-07_S4_C3]KEJ55670.1 putative membrane protein [Escherichia coli 3-267-03_S4_C1]KEN63048.1 putative membrane protein [Escherichia coli 1-392-07_S4_C3]KEO25695.1 putative membrane protein [Escherichia coli 2-460-0